MKHFSWPKTLFVCSMLFFLEVQIGWSWGFWGHKRINRIACFTLPEEMLPLFKESLEFLTEHAVDPDKRRYGVDGEAPRHYIDIDHYGEYPFENVPRNWDSAVAVLTEDTLMAYGIVPWHVARMTGWLTKAFESGDKTRILRTAADLGHYIADAHVPLHTTLNYNGQLTGQHGIHGLWESRIPELIGEDYDYFVEKAQYIENPLEEIWDIVLASYLRVDSVLDLEKYITAELPSDLKHSFEQRGETTIKVYSSEFSSEYNRAMRDMVERRMRQAIIGVGSFWMTAWVNAGQPDLRSLENHAQPEEEEELEKKFKADKIKGRYHGNTGSEAIQQ